MEAKEDTNPYLASAEYYEKKYQEHLDGIKSMVEAGRRNERLALVGSILQGSASGPDGLYFGIAEDALNIADAVLALIDGQEAVSEY